MKIMINNIEYQIKEMSQKDYKEFRKKEDEDAADISANGHDIIHKIVEDYFNENKM